MGNKWINYEDPNSLVMRRRRKRLQPLLRAIETVYRQSGKVEILDVGGKPGYWDIVPGEFLKEHKTHISIQNLDPLDESDSRRESPHLSFVTGDACDMPEIRDKQFDIAHSNSVIEHVGDWGRIRQFASEIQRVATYFFVQTPYFWFPIEPHFFRAFHHWLPWPLRRRTWMKHPMGQRGRASDIDEAMKFLADEPFLLDVTSLRTLFPECPIYKEKVLIFTKSIVAYRLPDPSKSSY